MTQKSFKRLQVNNSTCQFDYLKVFDQDILRYLLHFVYSARVLIRMLVFHIYARERAMFCYFFEMFIGFHERHNKKNIELFTAITKRNSKCLQKNEVKLREKRKNKKQRREAIQYQHSSPK